MAVIATAPPIIPAFVHAFYGFHSLVFVQSDRIIFKYCQTLITLKVIGIALVIVCNGTSIIHLFSTNRIDLSI